MASTFKDTKSALAAVQKKLQESVNVALENQVAEAVKDEEIMAIVNTVYNAYGNNDTGEPNVYERRYDSGGLVDRANMVPQVHGGTLSVWNLTPANADYGNAGYFAGEIVINGGPYKYPKGHNTFGDFNQPRDFIEQTYHNLRSSKSHVKALKEGLIEQGFDVK